MFFIYTHECVDTYLPYCYIYTAYLIAIYTIRPYLLIHPSDSLSDLFVPRVELRIQHIVVMQQMVARRKERRIKIEILEFKVMKVLH